jgi:gamma-glutamyl-gamma-aminobutyrate hydrolase PuuD
MSLPLIALVSDLGEVDGMPYHLVGDKYAAAIRDHAGGIPVGLLPTAADSDIEQIVAAFDGFLFTGSVSNVHPAAYGGAQAVPPFDRVRDSFALTLVRKVIARHKPALFVCRGFQELNIALGGTLLPDLAKQGGAVRHHPPVGLAYEERYAPAHDVVLVEGSRLSDVFGARTFAVNSLHYQGLGRIGAGLAVHGTAPDGLAEVIAVDGHPFAVGVQWHPEYRPEDNPASRSLLAAFGGAARTARASGNRGAPTRQTPGVPLAF